MEIQSVESFINIKGGFSRGIRDVYFVRAVGEPSRFRQMVENLDQKLNDAMTADRLFYIRLKELPNITDKQESDFYLAVYSKWKQGNPVSIKSGCGNPVFVKVLDAASRCAAEKYRIVRPNITDSIVRNFIIKLWHWTDLFLGEVLKDWSERSCMKIAADNVVKPQEYLFYYYCTLLGCDVLLLNNREDIKTEEKILQLSRKLDLGSFGTAMLPEYSKPVPKRPERRAVQKAEPRPEPTPEQQPVRPVVRNTRKIAAMQETQPVRTSRTPSIVLPARTENPAKQRKEKTFEELAQLASSIVMIAVHDRKGTLTSTGSGIMIGKKGFILTNCHVVKEGALFAVRIEDNDRVFMTSEVIKYNTDLDLAVLRIDKELKPLPVYDGRQKLVRGQRVVAIGSPLGLFNSVSDGIISGFRNIKNMNMIQFTAPISHGSSGGAVLNMYGEIIGISTAGIDSGQNINLAVDYENIRFFANGFF